MCNWLSEGFDRSISVCFQAAALFLFLRIMSWCEKTYIRVSAALIYHCNITADMVHCSLSVELTHHSKSNHSHEKKKRTKKNSYKFLAAALVTEIRYMKNVKVTPAPKGQMGIKGKGTLEQCKEWPVLHKSPIVTEHSSLTLTARSGQNSSLKP